MNLRSIIGFALGPIASAAFGLITVPIVAWIFSAEDVGRLNILQVTVSFFLLLLVLGLDQAYVREFHESTDRMLLLKACFIPGFILLVLVCVLTAVFGEKLSGILYGTANPVYLWFTLASVAVAFLSRFLSLILRMQERGLAFSISQAIPKLLMLLILCLIYIANLPHNFFALLVTFFISNSIATVVYLRNTQNQWRPAIETQLDIKQVRSLLNFGTPLIFSGLAYWGLAATSSIVLRSLSSFSELGIYSITTSIAGVATIFQSIFSVVWAPIVYKWAAEGDDFTRIDHVARHALAVVCTIFLACGIFSWISDYILPAQYAIVKYLVLCAVVQPLLYTLSEITCVGIGISRRTVLTIWVTVAALCTNVLLSLWLVPVHGAAGAIMANAVAYLVFFIARTEASAFAWRRFPRGRLYVFTGLSVTFAVATAALAPTWSFHYSLMWLALTPVVVWYFRLELKELLAAGYKVWNHRESI